MESFLGWMIESSLLVLIVFGLRRMFAGKVPYAVLQLLWVVVFLRFLVPVNLISTPYSVGNLLKTFLVSVNGKEEESLTVAGDTAFAGDGMMSAQREQDTGVLTREALEKQRGKNDTQFMKKGSEPDLQEEMAAVSEKSTGRTEAVLRKLRWIISGILLLWFFFSNCTLACRLKRDRILYRKKNGVPVYLVSEMNSPCLYGFFRPAIYIPGSLVSEDQISAKEMEQILMHEYVHFRHKDHLLSMLRMVLSAVYFFDPFLLFAVSCSKKDTELFCDETVIRFLGEKNRFAYGKMLIRMAGRSHFADFRYIMLTMSKHGREMENRIRAIGRKRHYSKKVLASVVLLSVLGLSVTCSAGTVSFAGFHKSIHVSEQKEEEHGAGLKTEPESANEENGISSQSLGGSISVYTDFLKENAGKTGFSYYSLARMKENSLVLFVTDTVDELTDGIWGSSSCKAYLWQDGKVTESSELVSDSNEWLRISDGVVWLGTRKRIIRAEFSSDMQELEFQAAERHTERDGGENTEYMTWLGEYAKLPGLVFCENPFVSGGVAEDTVLSYHDEDFKLDIYAVGKLSSLYVDELEDTFDKYWKYFTEAVNTGKTEKLCLVLDKDSIAYKEQCKWAKNYYERGIREKVKRYQIVSMEILSMDEEVIHSAEVIKTTYSDGSKKNLRQRYIYNCRYTENGWRITYMESEDAA